MPLIRSKSIPTSAIFVGEPSPQIVEVNLINDDKKEVVELKQMNPVLVPLYKDFQMFSDPTVPEHNRIVIIEPDINNFILLFKEIKDVTVPPENEQNYSFPIFFEILDSFQMKSVVSLDFEELE
jgi:hypothetical protein